MTCSDKNRFKKAFYSFLFRNAAFLCFAFKIPVYYFN